MKHFLCWSLLFFLTHLYGQQGPLETECAANAGGDIVICFSDNMVLSTSPSPTYANPPNVQWTYLYGALPPSGILISNPHDFTTGVQNLFSSTWPEGEYFFQFCVDCQDLNHNNQMDRPCDIVKVTVKLDVTIPVITENDGNEDNEMVGCHDVTFTVNAGSLLPDEKDTVYYFPFDGLVHVEEQNGVVVVTPNINGADCMYSVVYQITNDGCIREDTVKVRFINPLDPDLDGTIEGFINRCPACFNTVSLLGDSPGCGGIGTWDVIGMPPGADFELTNIDSIRGDATATVTLPGHYVFVYSVTNIEPCPDSHDTLECEIFQIGTFDLGPSQSYAFCDNIIPEGQYPICFESLENTVYSWVSNDPGVKIKPNNAPCADLVLDEDLSAPITVNVRATRFFIDKDCDGPEGYTLLELPYLHPDETVQEIRAKLISQHICFEICVDDAKVSFYGQPVVKVKIDTINLLCTNGAVSVRLMDYIEVTNSVGYSGQGSLISQDPVCPGAFFLPLINQYFPINVTNCNGCGQFVYRVVLIATDPATNLPSLCTTTFDLVFNVATAKVVTAGTDQIKCPQEIIRLNGSDTFCGVNGTWQQISCSNLDYYTVTIDNIHDPDTQIFVESPTDSICPPDTLCFVWSFNSQSGDCDLSDTTRVIIRDSCCNLPPQEECIRQLQVSAKCNDNQLTLSVLDEMNQPIDASEYTVHWLPMNTYGNPVTVPATGTLHFIVEVFKVVEGDTLCYIALTDTVRCLQEGCGAKVVESCDALGNIVLTLVDVNTGLPIPFIQYENIMTWTVYGGGANDPSGKSIPFVNPVTIQQDACYSLHYEHYIYPPDAHYHVPGYETDICNFNLSKTCPELDCPGPCASFSGFMIAGCGDALDLQYNLTFPSNCQSVCANGGTAGTLGIFHNTPPYNPVLPSEYNITWKNNAHTTYVNGSLNTINSITLTTLRDTCSWTDGYTPQCPCTSEPTNVHCEQPITKYCRPDGSFYYLAGAPQIVWTGVPGATGYTLEITTGDFQGCCNVLAGTTYVTVGNTTYWSIPSNLACFSIRIRANIPYCTAPTPWSASYQYCPQEAVCSQIITVCGCCHGERSADYAGLPVRVISETEMLAYLQANPGTEYATLREALAAAGVETQVPPEFRIFPNPASNRLVIQPGKGIEGHFSVQVTDLLQRNWLDQSFDASQSNTLDIDQLPQGVYFVTIRNAHGDKMLGEKITVVK